MVIKRKEQVVRRKINLPPFSPITYMPYIPIAKLAIDTEAEKPLLVTIYDPTKPWTITSQREDTRYTIIHTAAIEANRHGIGAKGPASMFVTMPREGDKPMRPLIYHVEWDTREVISIGSHPDKPEMQVSNHWNCDADAVNQHQKRPS